MLLLKREQLAAIQSHQKTTQYISVWNNFFILRRKSFSSLVFSSKVSWYFLLYLLSTKDSHRNVWKLLTIWMAMKEQSSNKSHHPLQFVKQQLFPLLTTFIHPSFWVRRDKYSSASINSASSGDITRKRTCTRMMQEGKAESYRGTVSTSNILSISIERYM